MTKDLQQAARELVSGWGSSPAERRLFAKKVRDFAAEQIAIAVEAEKTRIREGLDKLDDNDGFYYAVEDVRALVTTEGKE